jgi:branched-subunit amino acid aminotransferase/4-amino-4-deoxychorismate lyase
MTLWHDGAWLDRASAGACPDDRGLLLGDGLFETIRVRGGQPLRLASHLARICNSGTELGLPLPTLTPSLETVIIELVERNQLADAAVRLTLSAGRGLRGLDRVAEPAMSIWLTATPWMRPPAKLSLATSVYRRASGSPASRHKTLSYIDNVVARRGAREAGADMALIQDTAGHLSGADCANLFWTERGNMFTPALSCAVLPGTARAALLQAMQIEECEAGPGALVSADAIFVTNALIGAVPVSQIDGRPVGTVDGLVDRATQILAA